MKSTLHIAVIGAGAFGGWTALHLLERGARVTLLDAWGPGNSRASSGGETRIMRGTYGPNQPYTEMASRALKLWKKYERRWKQRFLHRTGVLWMVSERNQDVAHDDAFERGSIEMLHAAKIKYRELPAAQMGKRWPQINLAGIEWGIFEPECGYLEARASCQAVVNAFVAQGGKYRPLAVAADGLESDSLRGPSLSDGSRLKADIYVFACGPWLGKLFPSAVGDLVRATKQDVAFFGPPAGDDRFTDAHLPVWADHHSIEHASMDHASVDHGERFLYGIPGNERRGFKVADDTRGPVFDPTNGERVVSHAAINTMREYIAFRFPALKEAPVIETRVCQYEQTPDSNFIIDRHPANENVWIVGGGSGHGFKHGPAIGEMMAEIILKDREPPSMWRLQRFQAPRQRL
jgi:glycine/D-amino acid oxidase-like deaminating enzyme